MFKRHKIANPVRQLSQRVKQKYQNKNMTTVEKKSRQNKTMLLIQQVGSVGVGSEPRV